MTQPNPLAGEEAAGIAEYFEGDCACENARKCKSCDLKEMITEKLLSFSHQQAAPLVEALSRIAEEARSAEYWNKRTGGAVGARWESREALDALTTYHANQQEGKV